MAIIHHVYVGNSNNNGGASEPKNICVQKVLEKRIFCSFFSAMIKLHHTKKNSKKSYNKWKIKGFVNTKQRTIHTRYFVNCFRPFIIPGYPFRYDRTRFGCSLETMLISLRFIQKKVVYKLWK